MSDSNFSPEFGSPYQVLLDHCESAEIKFRAEPDVKGLFFSMRGEMAIYDVALLITHEDEVFQIYITIPIATTDEKFRPLVAEFVTRANHRIVIGHFDFDIDEGKLRITWDIHSVREVWTTRLLVASLPRPWGPQIVTSPH